MSSAGPSTPPSWVGSVVALALGVVLSVAVSALFGAFGWGGELASQTAGATSGAAPLLIDGLRHGRLRRAGSDTAAVARTRGDRPRKLLVVSCFAFALLLLDSAWGWFVFVVTLPLLGVVALLGVRRARRTQAAFDASAFFPPP